MKMAPKRANFLGPEKTRQNNRIRCLCLFSYLAYSKRRLKIKKCILKVPKYPILRVQKRNDRFDIKMCIKS